MWICIYFAQLETGLPDPILSLWHDTSSKCIINKTWIYEIWDHLSKCQCYIIITDQWRTLPQRKIDNSTMKLAHDYLVVTVIRRMINICHIHLQVITIDDITNFKGNKITQLAYYGKHEPGFASLNWPNQQSPPKTCGNEWKDIPVLPTPSLAQRSFMAPTLAVVPAYGLHHSTLMERIPMVFLPTSRTWQNILLQRQNPSPLGSELLPESESQNQQNKHRMYSDHSDHSKSGDIHPLQLSLARCVPRPTHSPSKNSRRVSTAPINLPTIPGSYPH
jgi:hypothetical protein